MCARTSCCSSSGSGPLAADNHLTMLHHGGWHPALGRPAQYLGRSYPEFHLVGRLRNRPNRPNRPSRCVLRKGRPLPWAVFVGRFRRRGGENRPSESTHPLHRPYCIWDERDDWADSPRRRLACDRAPHRGERCAAPRSMDCGDTVGARISAPSESGSDEEAAFGQPLALIQCLGNTGWSAAHRPWLPSSRPGRRGDNRERSVRLQVQIMPRPLPSLAEEAVGQPLVPWADLVATLDGGESGAL